MMSLMTLQSASGHYIENKVIGDIVGKPLTALKAKAPNLEPETMISWVTAIVIAYLEMKCQEEKGLWEMSVDKAKTVLIERGFIERAKQIIAQM